MTTAQRQVLTFVMLLAAVYFVCSVGLLIVWNPIAAVVMFFAMLGSVSIWLSLATYFGLKNGRDNLQQGTSRDRFISAAKQAARDLVSSRGRGHRTPSKNRADDGRRGTAGSGSVPKR